MASAAVGVVLASGILKGASVLGYVAATAAVVAASYIDNAFLLPHLFPQDLPDSPDLPTPQRSFAEEGAASNFPIGEVVRIPGQYIWAGPFSSANYWDVNANKIPSFKVDLLIGAVRMRRNHPTGFDFLKVLGNGDEIWVSDAFKDVTLGPSQKLAQVRTIGIGNLNKWNWSIQLESFDNGPDLLQLEQGQAITNMTGWKYEANTVPGTYTKTATIQRSYLHLTTGKPTCDVLMKVVSPAGYPNIVPSLVENATTNGAAVTIQATGKNIRRNRADSLDLTRKGPVGGAADTAAIIPDIQQSVQDGQLGIPAHRYTAQALIKGLVLHEFGNRPPTPELLVSGTGETTVNEAIGHILGRSVLTSDADTPFTQTAVDNVQCVASTAGQAIFRRGSGSWVTDGFTVGETVNAIGFSSKYARGQWDVTAVTATDLTVSDPNDLVPDLAAAAGHFVVRAAGGGDYTTADADLDAENVYGYNIQGLEAPAKSLEPIMIAYDVVSQINGGAIKFFKRKNAAIHEVALADLGAHASEDTPKEDLPFRVEKVPSDQLPSEVTVLFIDQDKDHAEGAVTARLLGPNSQVTSPNQGNPRIENKLQIRVPIAMTSAEARVIAERLLWRPWANRYRCSGTLPPSYQGVLENDILKIDNAFGTNWKILLQKVNKGADTVIQWEGISEPDATTVDVTAGGAASVPNVTGGNRSQAPNPPDVYGVPSGEAA